MEELKGCLGLKYWGLFPLSSAHPFAVKSIGLVHELQTGGMLQKISLAAPVSELLSTHLDNHLLRQSVCGATAEVDFHCNP